MDGFIAILGLGIVAFGIWLTVRIVNRREKWAIRLAVTAVAISSYPLSLGPTCWFVEHKVVASATVAPVYDPLFWLEFRAPASIQHAAMKYAKALGVEAAYIGVRDTPFLRRFAVNDLAFRWVGRARVFDGGPWILNWITSTIEPDSWEDLAGPGRISLSAENQTLDVSQSRRVHGEIVSFLGKVRSLKANYSRGRDRELDVQALARAIWGFDSEREFRPGVIRIESPIDDKLVVGDRSFSGIDKLIDYLRDHSRDMLRDGVFWSEMRREPSPGDADRLKEFCRTRDLDLFIRPNYGNIIGQPLPRNWWVVRASDSIYLDPE